MQKFLIWPEKGHGSRTNGESKLQCSLHKWLLNYYVFAWSSNYVTLSRSHLFIVCYHVFLHLHHPTVLTNTLFFGCHIPLVLSSIHSLVRLSGLISYRYHKISWTAWTTLIELTGNVHKPLVLMTWLDSGCQRWKVKVTAGRGKFIRVNTVASKSIFSSFVWCVLYAEPAKVGSDIVDRITSSRRLR